jgi:hypothetical protein
MRWHAGMWAQRPRCDLPLGVRWPLHVFKVGNPCLCHPINVFISIFECITLHVSGHLMIMCKGSSFKAHCCRLSPFACVHQHVWSALHTMDCTCAQLRLLKFCVLRGLSRHRLLGCSANATNTFKVDVLLGFSIAGKRIASGELTGHSKPLPDSPTVLGPCETAYKCWQVKGHNLDRRCEKGHTCTHTSMRTGRREKV